MPCSACSRHAEGSDPWIASIRRAASRADGNCRRMSRPVLRRALVRARCQTLSSNRSTGGPLRHAPPPTAHSGTARARGAAARWRQLHQTHSVIAPKWHPGQRLDPCRRGAAAVAPRPGRLPAPNDAMFLTPAGAARSARSFPPTSMHRARSGPCPRGTHPPGMAPGGGPGPTAASTRGADPRSGLLRRREVP